MLEEPTIGLHRDDVHKLLVALDGLVDRGHTVVVVEHDLAVLDYLSDYVCVLYGTPGGYGVVTMPFSVRQGINAFLAGFIPTENLRFRDDALTFKVRNQSSRKEDSNLCAISDGSFSSSLTGF